MKPTVMIIGLGGVGSILLELLAREEEIGQIIAGSLEKEEGTARCNLARMGAVAQGYSPSIRYSSIDLNQKEEVAEFVRREAPDLILNAATMQTWWLPDLLPPEKASILRGVRFGAWLPIHLTLSIKLMEALRDASFQGVTLTTPLPDVVNCILHRLDLTPTCGIGNIDEIVAKVRILAAKRLGTILEDVQVMMVAHHALEEHAFGERDDPEVAPWYLQVKHKGEDITERIRANDLVLAPYPVSSGPVMHFSTAGSAVRMIRACFSSSNELVHAPGPNGMPGGYPLIVSKTDMKPAPIEGLTLEKAVDINERSHYYDGIERIEPDGTAVFCDSSMEILRQELGYDCKRLPPNEAEHRAKELIIRFREYAEKHGVQLSQVKNLYRG